MNYKFINPPTPIYNKGVLVIDSDDGYEGDYTHWLPTVKRAYREKSYWYGINTAVVCPAINTANIGKEGFLNQDQLRELVKNGWEIQSHGKYHVGLGLYPVTRPLVAGATKIYMKGVFSIRYEIDYSYIISEGDKNEIIKFRYTEGDAYNEGFADLKSPLVNNYSTNATVRITENTAQSVLQGSKTDGLLWGIDMKHYVHTYHHGGDHFYNEEARTWVNQNFLSGRGRQGSVNIRGSIDRTILSSYVNTMTNEQVDTVLNQAALNDGLMVYYGHGESSKIVNDKLTYLIHSALDKGVRILTKTKALEYYGLI